MYLFFLFFSPPCLGCSASVFFSRIWRCFQSNPFKKKQSQIRYTPSRKNGRGNVLQWLGCHFLVMRLVVILFNSNCCRCWLSRFVQHPCVFDEGKVKTDKGGRIETHTTIGEAGKKCETWMKAATMVWINWKWRSNLNWSSLILYVNCVLNWYTKTYSIQSGLQFVLLSQLIFQLLNN